MYFYMCAVYSYYLYELEFSQYCTSKIKLSTEANETLKSIYTYNNPPLPPILKFFISQNFVLTLPVIFLMVITTRLSYSTPSCTPWGLRVLWDPL